MQRNNTPILIGVVLFGLLALGATALMFFRPAAGPDPAVPPVGQPTATPAPTRQWVARRNIPPRVRVTTADLESLPIQAGAVPPDAITSPEQITGLLTKTPIIAGRPISLSQFQPPLARVVDANIEIPSGFRAVGIWVDPDQTAAGLVDVGDRIDVIANHKLSWDKGPDQYVVGAVNFTVGRTIAQNLLVLGVDKSIKSPPPVPTPAPVAPGVPGAPVAAPTPAPPPPPPNQGPVRTRVILAAPPETAARLVAANDQGVLHIAIRNPDDADTAEVPGAREFPSTVVTIRKQPERSQEPRTVGAPLPMPTFEPQPTPQPLGPEEPLVPTPPAENEITVIRGTEKTRVIVPAQQ